MMGETTRRQQILEIVQSTPEATLQEIGDRVGVTKERVRQICVVLADQGIIPPRMDLRKAAIKQKKDVEKAKEIEVREYRKRIWRRMMFIGLRQRMRYMARINYLGLVRDHHDPGQEVVCQFRGCTRPVRARGFCALHYSELRRTGALWIQRRGRLICKEQDCFFPVYARNMCQCHYEKYMRKRPVKSGLPSNNSSGYRGVSWKASSQRWYANICLPSGKQEFLGSFTSKELAARAYDTAARKYYGERAKLNFPNDTTSVVKQQRLGVSGIRGISWNKSKGKWEVRITRHKKVIYYARFTHLEDAKSALSNRTKAE
jgi:hypothetical protein